MGIFDKLFSNSKADNSDVGKPINTDAYKKIVSIIDFNGAATAQAYDCIDDPAGYYEKNKDQYEERSVTDGNDLNEIIWLGLVDIFIEKDLMDEMDFKVELTDFVYSINNIVSDDFLTIEEEWFDSEEDISTWSAIVNEKWKSLGYVLACMDIDSDSYCTFIAKIKEYDILTEVARKTGHRIDSAQNM